MDTNPTRLTIIGDVGVDVVMGPIGEWPRVGTETMMERSELRPGGTAANAALAVSYLGGKSRLVSAVGNDDFGAWLAGHLQGLDLALQPCDSPTSVTVGFLHSCGERTFFTTRGHLERMSFEHVRARLSPASDDHCIALLSGPFLTPLLRNAYPELIEHLVGLGYRIALDTGWPPRNWDPAIRAEVCGWIAHCEHVLLNELEVTSLANEPDLAAAIEHLERWLMPGATLVVKTGARGAVGVRGSERATSPSPHATVFDTVGAGDSFNAGYLLARLQGADLHGALAAGCSAAVSIISRFPRRQIAPGELASSLTQTDLGHRERA
jgi:sugar/nucleoside kinase (ribokinase family)